MSGNQSLCTHFTFVAFSSLAELQPVFFIVFFTIYLFTMGGNPIIGLIWGSPSLHTPMYFSLVNLSFLEMCYNTSVVPQMLVYLLVEIKTIRVGRCAAQMYVFSILGLTECCLLAAMAYDHFVAICHPLHYSLLMDPPVCLKLAETSWTTRVVVESAQTTWIFTLPFCGTGRIQHFFCDIMPVVKLAHVDISHSEIVMSALSVPFILSLFPHSVLLCVRSGDHPENSFSHWQKQSFLHLLFSRLGTTLFTYLLPKAAHSRNRHGNCTRYTVVTPAPNPVIYTLRNKK